METKEMLKNIGGRTNGDIYFGVVGPVRTGKSTFIKKFMEVAILPNIENEQDKKRAIDELPQSGSGKTIMTTEPKFVPNNAVNVKVSEDFMVNVRMVDCVGYVFDEAKGFKDEDGIRMIKTPWFEESIPFFLPFEDRFPESNLKLLSFFLGLIRHFLSNPIKSVLLATVSASCTKS